MGRNFFRAYLSVTHDFESKEASLEKTRQTISHLQSLDTSLIDTVVIDFTPIPNVGDITVIQFRIFNMEYFNNINPYSIDNFENIVTLAEENQATTS